MQMVFCENGIKDTCPFYWRNIYIGGGGWEGEMNIVVFWEGV